MGGIRPDLGLEMLSASILHMITSQQKLSQPIAFVNYVVCQFLSYFDKLPLTHHSIKTKCKEYRFFKPHFLRYNHNKDRAFGFFTSPHFPNPNENREAHKKNEIFAANPLNYRG